MDVRKIYKIFKLLASLDFWENVAVAVLLPFFLVIFKPKYAWRKTLIFFKKTPQIAVSAIRWILKNKPRKITASALALLIIFTPLYYFFFAPRTQAAWWNDSWHFRQKLTIDHTQVAGDLTDFPVLVSLTDTDFASHAQTDGDDFAFTNSDGAVLKHEIESYNSGTGALIAWVKVPSLLSSSDTDIYIYYGNAATLSREDVEGLWSNEYELIWHLNEGDSTVSYFYQDSTDEDRDGTLTDADGDSATASHINGAYDFNGDADYIRCTKEIVDPSGTTQATLSAWVINDTGAINQGVANYYNPTSQDGVNLQTRNDSGEGLLFSAGDDGADFGQVNYEITDNWVYVTLVYDGSQSGNAGRLKGYVNGVEQNLTFNGSATVPASIPSTVNAGFTVGGLVGYSRYWDGKIDEVRLSGAARSADWIETEYNNQNDPASFFSVGSEETHMYPRPFQEPEEHWKFDEGQGSTGYNTGTNNSSLNATLNAGSSGDNDTEDEMWTDSGWNKKALDFDGTDDEARIGDFDF